MTLGEAIAEMRKQRGLTQADVARSVGVSPTHISLIENGKREPSLSLLKRMGSTLGVSLPVLFALTLSVDDVPEEYRSVFVAIVPQLQNDLIDALRSTGN